MTPRNRYTFFIDADQKAALEAIKETRWVPASTAVRTYTSTSWMVWRARSSPASRQGPVDLSASGTVEIRGKRVVVRDIPAVISRLQLMLDDFDHPRVDLRVVLQLVEASPTVMPATEGGAVPEPILGRLRPAAPVSTPTR